LAKAIVLVKQNVKTIMGSLRKGVVLLFVFYISAWFGTKTGAISGTLLDAKTKPLSFVVVSIQNSSFTQISAKDGTFLFTAIPAGEQLILLKPKVIKEASRDNHLRRVNRFGRDLARGRSVF
jgi:hypothetical protein